MGGFWKAARYFQGAEGTTPATWSLRAAGILSISGLLAKLQLQISHRRQSPWGFSVAVISPSSDEKLRQFFAEA
jgi:hypothetical protein